MCSYIVKTNFNGKVKTTQRAGQKGFGSGNIDVVITNCKSVFMRPIVEWFEEVNHVDLDSYRQIQKNKTTKSKIFLLTSKKQEQSWIKSIQKIFKLK